MPRRLGQHFLRASSVERLLRAVDPRPDESFVEIGPGAGALTLPLAARAGTVVAVELDAALAARLRERAPANVHIVTGDALRVDLRELAPAGARLVGNLPYYVSSPLLRRILDLHDRVRDVHVMLQDEVAVRVASPPGSKRLRDPVRAVRPLGGRGHPAAFPARRLRASPKVDSALLRARFRAAPRAEVDDLAAFERFVQTAFRQRRRTLENNLQDSYPNLKEHLRLLHIEGRRRAETLSVVEFAELYRALFHRA